MGDFCRLCGSKAFKMHTWMGFSACEACWTCELCEEWLPLEALSEMKGTFAEQPLRCCGTCNVEPMLKPEEKAGLLEIARLRPSFKVWPRGTKDVKRKVHFPEQPAVLFGEEMSLLLGDRTDAVDLQKLQELEVTAILLLCPQMLQTFSGEHICGDENFKWESFKYPGNIKYLEKALEDSYDYDLDLHLQECLDFLESCHRERRKILICCWAGQESQRRGGCGLCHEAPEETAHGRGARDPPETRPHSEQPKFQAVVGAERHRLARR